MISLPVISLIVFMFLKEQRTDENSVLIIVRNLATVVKMWYLQYNRLVYLLVFTFNPALSQLQMSATISEALNNFLDDLKM